MGSTKESAGKVNFKRGGGKTASYSVTGATLTFDGKLASDAAVSSISCQNHGGFKMEFGVEWNGRNWFFNPSTQTITSIRSIFPRAARRGSLSMCSGQAAERPWSGLSTGKAAA